MPKAKIQSAEETPYAIYQTLMEYGVKSYFPETMGKRYDPFLLPLTKALLKKKWLQKNGTLVSVTESGWTKVHEIAAKEGLLPLSVLQLLLQKTLPASYEEAKTREKTPAESQLRWAISWAYYLLQWSPSLTILLYSKGTSISEDVADTSPQEIVINGSGTLYDGSIAERDCFALLAPEWDESAEACRALVQALETHKAEIEVLLHKENIIPQKYTGPKSLH